MNRIVILVAMLALTTACRAAVGEGTIQLQELVSPTNYANSPDESVNKLITAHNARQDAVAAAALHADCIWTLDMEGDPRVMSIVYRRPEGRATMICGTQSGRLDAAKVTFDEDSVMYIDALYLLMFRKFNPADFSLAAGATGATPRILKADKEKLEFDDTGRLIKADFTTRFGTVVLKLSDHKILPGDAKAEWPTLIEVIVPAEMYPFQRSWEGKMKLKLDALRSTLAAPKKPR